MKLVGIKIAATAMIIAMAATVSGCVATSGNQSIAKKETVAQLEIGKSTKSDVEGLFGEPSNVQFTDTAEQWYYASWNSDYSSSFAAGALGTFIPFGGYASNAVGGKTEMSSLTVVFDEQGIVRKVGKGKQETSSGLVQF